MSLRKLTIVNLNKSEDVGDTARVVAKRFIVGVLKADKSKIGVISEVLEDLNGKPLPVGYTEDGCYILVTHSESGEIDGIADRKTFKLLHDIVIGEDMTDLRFITQSESIIPIAFIDDNDNFVINQTFEMVMDKDRFGRLVEKSLRRVRSMLTTTDWKIDVETPYYDYNE